MLQHDDVSIDAKTVVFANPLQRRDKCAASARIGELLLSVIATESQEVNLSRLLKAFQSPRHERMLVAKGLTRL